MCAARIHLYLGCGKTSKVFVVTLFIATTDDDFVFACVLRLVFCVLHFAFCVSRVKRAFRLVLYVLHFAYL